MKILSLDISHVPHKDFSIATVVEMYEDFIHDNQVIPDKIYIRAWQRAILTGGPDPKNPTWRGIPLEIK